MGTRIKKGCSLILFIFAVIFIAALGIPLVHKILFDIYSVSNYEKKEGIVKEVIIENKSSSSICENILVDEYSIFVKCGKDYKQQFKEGDKTTYYVYKNKAYHTEDQMKSGTLIGKLLDYGMIGSYFVLLFLIHRNTGKIHECVDQIGGLKNTNNC